MYTNMVDLNKKFTQSSFSIFVMEEPCCFVFGKRGKNILQDGDFFKYSKNYTRKEKSYWKCIILIPSCKGRAITSGDFIVEKTQHDHTVDTSFVRARNIETNLIKHKFDQGKSGKLLEYFENTYIGMERKPKASENPRCFL